MPEYDVFLSHNSADKKAVEIIAHRLREDVKLRPFLDKWHLIPGEPWQEAIEEALGQSETVTVFVGPSGISPWHNEEMRAGLDQAVRTHDNYRIIPVLLPGASEEALTRFLARRTWVDFRPGLDDAEAFERLVSGIKGEVIDAGTYELPGEPSPYRGLLRFEAKHRRFFFGRDADRQRLVEKLEHRRFVAVVGASGSGKSSLVRAGLLPDLADDVLPGSREWNILVFTPSSQPLRSLANQLASLATSTVDRPKTADDLTQRLVERTDGLRTAVTAYLADRPQPLLLVVDQFEELFTLCQDKPDRCRAQTEQFIANLADAVQRGDGQFRVLVTLRADFLDRCLSFPVLSDLLEDRQVLLGPLDGPALREAVARPAQEVGALFEKGLVSMILRDVEAEPGALPLLQHALYELWQARRGPWLTIDAYEASGGVQGALQRRAQATYDALIPEQQTIARNVFLRLTAFGEGVSDTRRRVNRAEMYTVGTDSAQVDAVLQVLSGPQTRLIIANEHTAEVTHEALIQKWGTLREWLEQDREALRIHRRLTVAAGEWKEKDLDASYLYRGVRLLEAEEWAKTHAEDLSQLEREFLDVSVAFRDLEAQEAKRRRQERLEQAQRLAEEQQRRAEEAEARRRAEEARAYEAEAREQAQRRSAIRLRWLVVILTVIALIAPGVRLYKLILQLEARGEVVLVPGGWATIGSASAEAFPDESPIWETEVQTFKIERFEVTNRQYRLCVQAGGCMELQDASLYKRKDLQDCPVVYVTALQAAAYCQWLGRRLPSEVEWEWAAQGAEDRIWPWGDEAPENIRLNVGWGPSTEESLHAANSHPTGNTPDTGIFNLAGNAMEWTASQYQMYNSDQYTVLWMDSNPDTVPETLVVRGGSFANALRLARPTARWPASPLTTRKDLGFRCAQSIP